MDIVLNAYLSPQDSHPNEIQESIEILEKDNLKCKLKTKKTGTLHITDLPPEIFQHILRSLSFDAISKLRMVSKYFNEICSSLLNSEFNHLRAMMLQKFHTIKALMPRRESARRKHPLARESDIIETLHMRLSLLHMTFGKHIERNYCCFFPGEIIDEIYRILRYIRSTPSLNRAYKVTDELFDLSTMAMEYFKEHIEPSLPEISYLTHDLLEHNSFLTPRSDLAIQRAQLMQLECTNIRKEANQPKNDSVTKFQKQLKNTREIAKRNRREIIKIKQSLKSAKKRVSTVIKELEEIKWQQKNCKKGIFPEYCNLNDILFDIKRQKQELLKCTSLSNCPSNDVSMSEHFLEKNNFISELSSCEKIPSNCDKTSCSLLNKCTTTVTNSPEVGNNEIADYSLKVPDENLHTSNKSFDIFNENVTYEPTKCDSN